MVISLEAVVRMVIFLLVAAAVFGLLFWLIDYVGRKFPGEGTAMFVKFAQVFLVVCGCLILIGILLSFAGVIPPITLAK